MPEEYGGAGIKDFRLNAIVNEEFWLTGAVGIGLGVQNDILAGYFAELTTDEQKERWLPGYVSGELITAIAMSEPGAGSDLANLKTSARRDGGDYVVNGAKTFISNGLLADLVVVACRTNPDADKPHKGISLLAIESGADGFSRGRKLDKIGQRSADTAELIFEDVRVPAENLIGEENRGFYHLMRHRHPRRSFCSPRGRFVHSLRARSQGVRPTDWHVPGQPSRHRTDAYRTRRHAGLRRQMHHGGELRRVDG
jgi:alkylation response protein AidB-like acyl-CoA dehydrogenase